MRGRAPSLLTHVERALEARTDDGAPHPTRLLVATSGGPDSQALLHALARLAPAHGLTLVAHGIDHGLRPEAGAELDLAEALARDLGVPFARTRLALSPGGNLQARARAARHEALARAAESAGAEAVAFAHSKDDRAETVLLRLLRGAGARGLGVLPARGRGPAGAVVRPLVHATRADVLAHLERHRVDAAQDPSNRDVRHLRVRVRTELLPVLRALDPGIVEHLARLAAELAHETPAPLELSRPAAEALARLVRGEGSPGAEVWLPGGLVVRRAEPHADPGAVDSIPRGPAPASAGREPSPRARNPRARRG